MITLECNYQQEAGFARLFSPISSPSPSGPKSQTSTKFKPKAPGCINCSRKASIPASRKPVICPQTATAMVNVAVRATATGTTRTSRREW